MEFFFTLILLHLIWAPAKNPADAAGANLKMNYQGSLRSNAGVPVNTVKGFRFRIRDGNGGAIQWESACTDVVVSSGLVRATLGLTNAAGNWNTVNWAGIDAHLEMLVGDPGTCSNAVSMSPQERLLAGAYSLSHSSVSPVDLSGSTQTKAGGLNIPGNIGIGTAAPGARLEINDQTAVGVAATLLVLRSESGGREPFKIIGSTAYVNLSVNLRVEDTDILQINPYQTNFTGSANQVAGAKAMFGVGFSSYTAWDGASAGRFVGSSNGTYFGINTLNSFTGNLLDAQYYGTSRMVLTSGGLLGVGTTNPGTLLHVSSAAGTNGPLLIVSTGTNSLFEVTGSSITIGAKDLLISTTGANINFSSNSTVSGSSNLYFGVGVSTIYPLAPMHGAFIAPTIYRATMTTLGENSTLGVYALTANLNLGTPSPGASAAGAIGLTMTDATANTQSFDIFKINSVSGGSGTGLKTILRVQQGGADVFVVPVSGNIGIGVTTATSKLDIVGGSLTVRGGGGVAVAEGHLIVDQGNLGIGAPATRMDVSGGAGAFKAGISGGSTVWTAKTGGGSFQLAMDYGMAAIYVPASGALEFTSWPASYISFKPGGSVAAVLNSVGNLGIGTASPTSKFDLLNGSITIRGTDAGLNIRTLGSGAGTALSVDADGNVIQQTSSRRYKENVQPLKENFHKILAAQPKSFRYKDSRQEDVGYIAEEFDGIGMKDLVLYKDGVPHAIKYDRVSLSLLEIIKDLKQQNAAIKERIRALEEK